MNKIEFLKNNIKQEVDMNSISFKKEEMQIIRETDESLIVLDFIKKKCYFTLKYENITLDIKVLEMSYIIENNTMIFSYTLESEPEVKNTIKIKIKET